MSVTENIFTGPEFALVFTMLVVCRHFFAGGEDLLHKGIADLGITLSQGEILLAVEVPPSIDPGLFHH